MPRQIPSLIALFLVVTFGSALDVAAIQSDTPFPLVIDLALSRYRSVACHSRTTHVAPSLSDGCMWPLV